MTTNKAPASEPPPEVLEGLEQAKRGEIYPWHNPASEGQKSMISGPEQPTMGQTSEMSDPPSEVCGILGCTLPIHTGPCYLTRAES